MKYTYKYKVIHDGKIIKEGETKDYGEALRAFRGLNIPNGGNIVKYDKEGNETEVAFKPYGKSIRRWE